MGHKIGSIFIKHGGMNLLKWTGEHVGVSEMGEREDQRS
jgi:hypothetical protein